MSRAEHHYRDRSAEQGEQRELAAAGASVIMATGIAEGAAVCVIPQRITNSWHALLGSSIGTGSTSAQSLGFRVHFQWHIPGAGLVDDYTPDLVSGCSCASCAVQGAAG